MKKSGSLPREVLLASPRSLEKKLDQIRSQVLRENFEAIKPSRHPADDRPFTSVLWTIWREIFAPARTTWAVIVTAWLLIVGFNYTDRGAMESTSSNLAEARPASGDLLMAFREQEKLLKELIGPVQASTDADTRRRKESTKPRSERLPIWRTV